LQDQARSIQGSAWAAREVVKAMRSLLDHRGHTHVESLVTAIMATLRKAMNGDPAVTAAERILERMRESYGCLAAK